MKALLASPADWISPQDDGESGDYQGDPPAADGRKVSIADTDHIYGTGGDAAWVWKTFTRGHNPIYMDPIRWDRSLRVSEADLEGARRAMGRTSRFAERVNLAAMKPAGDIASTKFCMADPGREYLVYQPKGGEAFSVMLKAGSYRCEWFDVAKGTTVSGGSIRVVDGPQRFEAPSDLSEDVALHMKLMD